VAFHSEIEWTGSTWNPITGCTKLSLGCQNCYAERLAKRLQAMGNTVYTHGFRPTVHPHLFELPLRWKKPQMIFVNSMSDLFLEDVPASVIRELFGIMERAHWHTFQVLTKRSRRLLELAPDLPWRPNIWMGVTVESSDYMLRIDDLRGVEASVKFVSFEPLLGPLPDLNLQGIGWAIVGGESGPRARPMAREWATSIRDKCRNAGIPFFFKQWGGTIKKRNGRQLDGKVWNEMPTALSDLDAAGNLL